MTKALVTGANGHIGSNLVRELLEHDYAVRAMVRSGSDTRGIDGLDVELVNGDVLDAASVERAVEGVDVVFHLAAPYKTWAKDRDEIVKPAVEGTRNVLRAMDKHGVKRVVATSSCNAVGFTPEGDAPRNESYWNDAKTAPYFQAKVDAERLAFQLAEELGLELMTVLPTTVLGGFDYRGTPTTKPFMDAFKGKSPVPFDMNLIDVRDVAKGHRLAMENGSAGQRYLLGGENYPAAQIADAIEAAGGKRPPVGMPPELLLRAVAKVGGILGQLTGKPPMISTEEINDAKGKAPVFDCSKARNELGLECAPIDTVIGETHRWGKEMGWL